MKERGIIFSGPMVKAILGGQKTQTRRTRGLNRINENPDDWTLLSFDKVTGIAHFQWHVSIKFPCGVVGDRLYMRETYCTTGVGVGGISYKASGHWKDERHKWKSGRFMPKILARPERFEITDIRVERVQDISEEDAIAEGILANYPDRICKWRYITRKDAGCDNPISPFRELWDSINAKRGYGWQNNPWVWVIAFRKL